ncbi:MAG: hypothetical protein QHJ73_06190 [Armatimonadota bacterium]|nr:hypothetical protein [Armatimonadota bacterium]
MEVDAVFTREGKRKIAIRLVASGCWRACDWPALSAIVRSRLLGLDEAGRVVPAPNAAELLAEAACEEGPRRRHRSRSCTSRQKREETLAASGSQR